MLSDTLIPKTFTVISQRNDNRIFTEAPRGESEHDIGHQCILGFHKTAVALPRAGSRFP
jgi:hypothetical protein